ncbi:MAG: hypothetical protein WAU59_02180, partial [Rhodoplanes sp.]
LSCEPGLRVHPFARAKPNGLSGSSARRALPHAGNVTFGTIRCRESDQADSGFVAFATFLTPPAPALSGAGFPNSSQLESKIKIRMKIGASTA